MVLMTVELEKVKRYLLGALNWEKCVRSAEREIQISFLCRDVSCFGARSRARLHSRCYDVIRGSKCGTASVCDGSFCLLQLPGAALLREPL